MDSLEMSTCVVGLPPLRFSNGVSVFQGQFIMSPFSPFFVGKSPFFPIGYNYK